MDDVKQTGPGECENTRAVQEVSFCGYADYNAAVLACEVSLPKAIGAVERRVLEQVRKKFNGSMTRVISKTLLFGDVARGLTKTELAALVKLVRRGLVNLHRVPVEGPGVDDKPGSGYRHRWDVADQV